MAVALAVTAAALDAQEGAADTPAVEALVAQLADPAKRAAAKQQLLVAGAAAVAPLCESLGDADVDLVTAALGVLADLGPAAGSAFPRVFDLYRESTLRAPAALATMAELAPWRPPDWTLTWNEVVETNGRLMRASEPGHARQWTRLAARFTFPRDVSVAELARLTRSRSPWRLQLALDLLARRGAEAAAALPALREVLQRRMAGAAAAFASVRDDAARAVLAIAPDGELAALAHEQLAGHRPPPDRRPVPPRVRDRIRELLLELAASDTHDTARANLEALGEIAAGPLGDALAAIQDARAFDTALGVLTSLGERAGEAVPGLMAELPKRDLEHTAAILRTLTAIAPYGELLVDDLELDIDPAPQPVHWHGRPIPGVFDFDRLCVITFASLQLRAALEVDPGAPLAELRDHLDGSDVFVRERALQLLSTRGPAPDILPKVARMMDEQQPVADEVRRSKIRATLVRGVDRTPFVRRAAAMAVLALASPEDELVTRARRVLAEPPPK